LVSLTGVVFLDHKELNSSKNPKGSFGSLFLC
jgi:hypothetical protein